MLLLIQKPIIKASPLVTDSLKHSLTQMQHKVDSLQKVVLKTEIGTGFFSDVITQDLTMFTSIIIVAGLFSWGWVVANLQLHKRQVTISTEKRINLFESQSLTRIEKLETNLLITTANVHSGQYFMIPEEKLYAKLNSAIETLEAYFNCKTTHVDNELRTWGRLVYLTSELLKFDGFKLDNDDRLAKNLLFLAIFQDSEFLRNNEITRDQVKQAIENIYVNIYSKDGRSTVVSGE